MTQKEGNSLEELEARQKLIPFALSQTNYKLGWKVLQAVRFCNMSDTVEFSLPAVPLHTLLLTFELDPTQTVVPPLDGFNSTELFSTMMGSSGS